MTPEDAFLPNSVPCGPRSTSMRSMSGRSESAAPAWPVTTPSTTYAELLSIDSDANEVVPTPRMKKPKLRGPALLETPTPGTRYARSVAWLRSKAPSESAETTATDTGTSCSRSSRFCAVTVTVSSNRSPSAALAGDAKPAASKGRAVTTTTWRMAIPLWSAWNIVRCSLYQSFVLDKKSINDEEFISESVID